MAALRCSALVACLALLVVHTDAQKAPRFKACKRNQPAAKLNECVRDSLQKAIPELVKGVPEYGLMSLDPLRVESLDVAKSKKSNAVSVDITFKNLDIIGLGNSRIRSAEVDVEKYRMKTKIDVVGNVNLQGDYRVKGKVLVLPIEGTGKCNITLVNPKGEITEVVAKPVTRNGKQYAEVTSLKFVVYNLDRVYYDFQNLFNGNKQLGDNMNMVLNDNWREVVEDMRVPVQAAFATAFRRIANQVVSKVPYNVVFP